MTTTIRAVSLDLDETLWETMPVLLRAEQRLQDWLDRHYPRLGTRYGLERFRALRMIVAREHPDRSHDLTWLRTEALRRAALDVGYPETVAPEAFEVFLAARCDIDPFPDVRPALARLAAVVPVYALSNGNACVQRVGLGDYFAGAIAPHHAGAAKPDPRIYRHLLDTAGVDAPEMLHVGDDPYTDVHGAREAGLRTAWMNRGGQPWREAVAPADYEFRDMAELVQVVLALTAALASGADLARVPVRDR
jgi:FMN hydrolase / 5-amino-6-(5-phospho-D-ribitylamino)uracil phosphatase